MKTLQGNQLDTRCKFKDLKWLADVLLKKYTFILQPAFPSEKGAKHEFELWLMYILQHPILRTSEVSKSKDVNLHFLFESFVFSS